MPTIEMQCTDRTNHGTHVWRPDARPAGECFLPRYLCNGWWPHPKDDGTWPLQRRPRWVSKDQYWHWYEGGCQYCGQLTGRAGLDHAPALCGLCGTVQCQRGSTCQVCYSGFMPGYRPGQEAVCGYAGCERTAVAKAPRIRRVCKGCVPRVTTLVAGRRILLAQYVTETIAVRDSGKAPLKWRLVA